MIPDFDERGNLPAGIFSPTLEEFETRFVKDVRSSRTREDIFHGYISYCRDLLLLDVAMKQWVDGSYTTSKIDPNDIDIVSHINALKINNRQIADQLARLLKDRGLLKHKYRTDAYSIAIYPENHRFYEKTLKYLDYWQNYFGRDRGKNPKGIIEFNLDDDSFLLDG